MKQKCRPQAYRFMNMLPSTKLVGLSWNWLISKLASIIFRQNFHFLQKKYELFMFDVARWIRNTRWQQKKIISNRYQRDGSKIFSENNEQVSYKRQYNSNSPLRSRPRLRKLPGSPYYLGLRGITTNTRTTSQCPETERSKIEFCLILFGYRPTPC